MATAKIIITDEPNCKILGLELNTRKKLVKKFKYEVPGARYTPAVKLGRWDGMKSFFNLGGTTYTNLLPEILPILEEDGYYIELEDLRDYRSHFDFELIDENSYAGKTWPKGHPLEGQPIVLRDYQVSAVNDFLQNTQSMQVLATGSGKTITSAVLSHKCEPYGRTIIIVPNCDLVKQTEADYINLGLDVGVFYGGRKEFTKTHTICTWQSLNSLFKRTKNDEAPIPFGDFIDGVVCVMVDECFDGSAKVSTTEGYVAIRDIKVGDTVINYSESDKIFKYDTVVKLHRNLTSTMTEKMYQLEFYSGETVQVTGNHKYLTYDGWVRADELQVDQEIVSPVGMVVKSGFEITKPTETYNLHIQTDHNYIVEGSVVSNCHGIKADALTTMLTGVMAKIPIRWAFTGTIPKDESSKRSLQVAIGDVISKVTASELQDKGVLANCHVNVMQLIDYVEYKDYQAELKYLLDTEKRIEYIAQMISAISEKGNTLVLIDRITPGKALAAAIEGAVFLSGATKTDDRKEQYDLYATESNKVSIATYGIAAVGLNITRIENLVLIEPGKSFVKVIQSIGRGLRKGFDKDHVEIYDVTSTCKFAKRHLTQRKAFYKEANYPFTIKKVNWQE